MKYKITIQKITEYPEETKAYHSPKNPEKMFYSRYDVEEPERSELVSHQRPTGKILETSEDILEQIVETEYEEFITDVVKAINQI